MNLHGIAGPVISAVNPTIIASFQGSNGFSQNADFSQTAAYLPPVSVPAQVQQLSQRELQHLEQLNLQGAEIGIYLYGIASGAVRVSQKGGDIITVVSGARAGVYLTTAVLEQWPDWVKVACTLQNQDVGSTSGPSLDYSQPGNSQYQPGLSE